MAVVKKKLQWVEKVQCSENPMMVEKIKCVQQEVDDILEKEDVHWKQRAKMHWLQNGDRSTKFFHMCAN